jgi:hypothetical protein
MNVRVAALSITLVASASMSFCPAFAGPQEGGMRWKFAPNIYKLEQPRIPQEDYSMGGKPVRPAMEGKVPHGPSFLGVDPQFLRPAPVQRPATTSTQAALRHPSVAPISINSPFRPNFGAPSAPPLAALPKMLPSFGTPSALPQTSANANKSVAGKLMPRKSQPVLAAHRSVAGRLLPRKQPAAAVALTPTQAYPKGFGYLPGFNLPSSASSGMSSSSNVSGKLLTHHKH